MAMLVDGSATVAIAPIQFLWRADGKLFIAALLRDGRPAHGGRLVAENREPPVPWAMPTWLEREF
jgi:hypothetical protein